MPESIHERVRAAQAAQDKTRKAAEYAAGESQRRRDAARFSAQVRQDNRIEAIADGRAEPRTRAEWAVRDRIDFDTEEL